MDVAPPVVKEHALRLEAPSCVRSPGQKTRLIPKARLSLHEQRAQCLGSHQCMTGLSFQASVQGLASKSCRGTKNIEHRQLFGIVPGTGQGQICLCCAKKQTHKQIPRKSQEKAETVPGSRAKFVHIVRFLFIGYLSGHPLMTSVMPDRLNRKMNGCITSGKRVLSKYRLHSCCYRALGSPYKAIASPYRHSIPLSWLCLIIQLLVSVPNFSLHRPACDSKNARLGWA